MSNFFNKLKNIFNELTNYNSPYNYDFIIPESHNDIPIDNNDTNTSIYKNINKNLEYMKSKYNSMLSSDVVIREFTLNARDKQFSAFIFHIDGMSDSTLINSYILKPLMLKNRANSFNNDESRVISEISANNVTIRKVKKFNIENYIDECLLPQNSVSKSHKFSEIISGINSGNCALFVDTLDIGFDIDVKGIKQRSVDTPNNEIVIKGPQEAFVENIRTNTALVRRIVNNENLVIENIEVGNISKTKCAVCYLQNIANDDLVAEVKFRLNNLDIDSLLSSRRTRTTYSVILINTVYLLFYLQKDQIKLLNIC